MPLPSKVTDLIPLLNLIPHPEGGFFTETYRSGTKPMSTQGQTGFSTDKHLITTVDNREKNRPHDHDIRRNALTSIYWVPTIKSPKLKLCVNCSDTVHYYQGGKPFEYILYDVDKCELKREVLGPDLQSGHTLQVCVRGGVWKCGAIVGYGCDEEEDISKDQKDGGYDHDDYDYSLIGEAVSPGFDFHDFSCVHEKAVRDKCQNDEKVCSLLIKYLYECAHIEKEWRGFYEENDTQKSRVEERS